MPKVLLDFPWNLTDVLDSYSPVLGILRRFENLRASHGLLPIPFISETECSDLWLQVPQRPRSGINLQHVRILLSHSLRQTEAGCLATPILGPGDLSDTWRSALRESMADLEDWRNPQILFSEIRMGSWPNTPETSIQFELCEEKPASGPYQRVLVCLEDYHRHWFATCDFDPWDLHRMDPPAPDAPAHQQHPCCLPKPPGCEGVSLEALEGKLREIRDWNVVKDKYYFIPPRDWNPEGVSKQNWRQWKAFRFGRLPGNNHEGPMDYKGEPWWWDRTHRHWDVQLKDGGYWSVSHTGRLIAKKD